jgi:hypothetical protein
MGDMEDMRKEYWEHVRTSAEEIERDVRSGELDPEDAMERVENDCDSQWSIYTYRAKCVVCFLSDNPDALSDELGSDGLLVDSNLNWSGMAFWAMRADILDRLGDLEEIAAEGREEREAAEEATA